MTTEQKRTRRALRTWTLLNLLLGYTIGWTWRGRAHRVARWRSST